MSWISDYPASSRASTSGSQASGTPSTKQSYFAKILRTVHQALRDNAGLCSLFERTYREHLCSFDFLQHIASNCVIPPSRYVIALRSACDAVLAEIDQSSRPLPVELVSVKSVLSSDLVALAIEGLSLVDAPAKTRLETHSAPKKKRVWSRTDIDNQLAAIKGYKYRSCPRKDTDEPCRTCDSAFAQLELTECLHKGRLCLPCGQFPHFTKKMMRQFKALHQENRPLPHDLDSSESVGGEEDPGMEVAQPEVREEVLPIVTQPGTSAGQASLSAEDLEWAAEVELESAAQALSRSGDYAGDEDPEGSLRRVLASPAPGPSRRSFAAAAATPPTRATQPRASTSAANSVKRLVRNRTKRGSTDASSAERPRTRRR